MKNKISDGLQRGGESADLRHHLVVDRRAPGGVDQNDIGENLPRLRQNGGGEGLCVARRGFYARRFDFFGERLQLLESGRAAVVGADQKNPLFVFLLQALGDFGEVRRFADALQSARQNHGRIAAQIQRRVGFAHRPRQFAVREADKRLPRRD